MDSRSSLPPSPPFFLFSLSFSSFPPVFSISLLARFPDRMLFRGECDSSFYISPAVLQRTRAFAAFARVFATFILVSRSSRKVRSSLVMDFRLWPVPSSFPRVLPAKAGTHVASLRRRAFVIADERAAESRDLARMVRAEGNR